MNIALPERSRSGNAAPDARQLAQFFAMAKDLFAVADLNGRFLSVNDAWEATLGWTAAELTSRPFLAFVHPDDVDATIAETAACANHATAMFVNRYRTKGGDWRWLEWTSRTSAEDEIIYASARDITDRMAVEA